MSNIFFNDINYLKQTHMDFCSFSQEFKFDGNSAYHISIVSFYGSILELTESCIVLIENNVTIAVPIIIRSILECYLDLKNMTGDINYGYHLRMNFLHESTRFSSSNKNLLMENSDFKRTHDLQCQEYKELEKNGYSRIKVYKKFELADMLHEYNSFYNRLCADSHGDFSALSERHLSNDEKNKMIIFNKKTDQDSLAFYIIKLSEYLIKSTFLIHRELGSSALSNVELYFNELENYMDKVSENA
jgi:uncharacterized protein DUF5677